jgi:hypothetical protein
MELNIDLTIILTGLGVAIAIVGANIALIAWLRADMKSFESEVRGWREAMAKETKDFHGRLCVIQERSKKGECKCHRKK